MILNTLELVGKQESVSWGHRCSDSSITHDFALRFIQSVFDEPSDHVPTVTPDSLFCALGTHSNKC